MRASPGAGLQRMLFPAAADAVVAVALPPAGAAPDRNAVTVTIAPASGPPLSGVLVEESDFYIALRDADGTIRTVRRTPGLKVTKTSPLQAHIDLLDRISDSRFTIWSPIWRR